jgi:PAS domain S-box-containing protein
MTLPEPDRIVTDRSRSPEEIARSERRLLAMLTSLSVTVTVIGPDGEVRMSTGQQVPVLGYPASWWEGRSLVELAHPDDAARGAALLEQAASTPGRTVSAEVRARHADGHYEWLEVTVANRLDDPDITGLVVTSRNVTQHKRIEEALHEGREDALRVARAKSDYVAAVSHELRSPLHAILGLAELLERAGLEPEAGGWAAGIHREADRLRRIIDDVLDLSRLEAGRMTLEPRSFSLRDLAAEVMEVLRGPADGRGLRLTYDVPSTLQDARLGEPDRLRQVLVNLVGNAVKFTPEGFVELEIVPADDGDGRDRVAFKVTDSGTGIPADAIEHLFEAFHQVDASSSRDGAGLGLAISDRLVRLMGGGAIEVTTLEGHGSTFSFELPLPVADAVTPAPTPAGDEHPVVGGRVLVVDDNATNRVLIEAQLAHLGHDAVVVGDGDSGARAATSEAFDVVLMDLQMPGVDGVEATRRIRRAEFGTGRHVPVLALTASVLASDRDRCRRAGMDGFLAKPIELAELGAALADWIPDVDPASGGSGGPVVDTERLDRLATELGDDAVQSVIDTYRDELPRRVDDIVRAYGARDGDGLRRAAHGLRSPSGMLGAVALAEECRRIEESDEAVPAVSPDALNLLAEHTASMLRRPDPEGQPVGRQKGEATR